MSQTNRALQTRNNSALFRIIIFSFIWSLIILWPHLIDKYRVSIDVQNHYWMALFQKPSLFPNDPLLYTKRLVSIDIWDYSLILYPRSVGYALLIWAGSFLIDPIWFVKYLWVFLLPLVIVFLYKYGKTLKNDSLGISLSLFFVIYHLASPDSLSLASGLQRAFQLPIIIGFLYFLQRHQGWFASLIIVFAALFYLPIVPLLLITYLLTTYFSSHQDQKSRQVKIISWEITLPFILAAVISLGLAFWAITSSNLVDGASLSVTATPQTNILNNPRYQAGGAAPIYLRFPWIGRAGVFESFPEAVIVIVMLISSTVVYFFLPKGSRSNIPPNLWYFGLAGMVMFFLANLSLFLFSTILFYMPSRYLRCQLILISILTLSLNSDRFIHEIKSRLSALGLLQIYLWFFGLFISIVCLSMVVFGFSAEGFGWSLLIIWGVILTFSILFWLSGFNNLFKNSELFEKHLKLRKVFWSIGGIVIFLLAVLYSRLVGFGTINPSPAERDLYAFLQKLPEDIILAGSPEELTEIPLFAERSVLIRDLRPSENTPILENFKAYYTEDPEDVFAFCDYYKVDFLVVNENDYKKSYISGGDFFYHPYNKEIQDYLSNRQNFILPEINSVFASGPLRLIPCSQEAFLQ